MEVAEVFVKLLKNTRSKGYLFEQVFNVDETGLFYKEREITLLNKIYRIPSFSEDQYFNNSGFHFCGVFQEQTPQITKIECI